MDNQDLQRKFEYIQARLHDREAAYMIVLAALNNIKNGADPIGAVKEAFEMLEEINVA